MKIFALVLFMSLAAAINSTAQLPIGVRAGLNLAAFGGPDASYWSFLEGEPKPQLVPRFHLGAFAVIDNFYPLVLEPGLQLSTKGTQYRGQSYELLDPETNTITPGEEITRVKYLTYVDIPLIARYFLTERINAFLGLQPSLLFSARTWDKGSSGASEKQNVKDEYGTLDIGVLLGLQVQLESGFNVQLGYDHGLADIVTYGSEGGGMDYYVVKNRVLKIGIGYIFGHNGERKNRD